MDTCLKAKNISALWATAFLELLSPGRRSGPMSLIVRGIAPSGPSEDFQLKSVLDMLMKDKGELTNEQVAFTIFPNNLYKIVNRERGELFSLYNASFPHYQAEKKQLNRRGLYFERLIHFDGDTAASNQLEWIIGQHKSRTGVRQSMYQAAIFDPRRDHVADARLVFPCLQHISFVPNGTTLVMNAFYATQQFLNKAYGNYLGLGRLAAFMATEMNFQNADLQVYVGVPKLEGLAKTSEEAKRLREACEHCLVKDQADEL
jgi:hypothetical protein